MPAREFQGVIHNAWDEPLFWSTDSVDSGDWQEPWYPHEVPGAGKIDPSKDGEWRTESTGIGTGTSGWARWAVQIVETSETPTEHFEWIQVNWSLPFLQTEPPNVTCAVFRNDPAAADSFTPTDASAPDLEIVPTRPDGSDVTDVVESALYVLTVPASFFADAAFHEIALLRLNFVVRKRAGTQASPLTFPSTLPTREQSAMEAFRNRMQSSAALGFVGGFPTFYESVAGRDHLGGTVFIRAAAGGWHDVPLTELGNVSLSDFAARIRAANTWASAQLSVEGSAIDRSGHLIRNHLYVGAFPTFFHADYGHGVVCGIIALNSEGAQQADIPISQLGQTSPDNFEARFRTTQDWAQAHGFVGGFPSFIDRPGLVLGSAHGPEHTEMLCGAVLLKSDHAVRERTNTFAERRDILLFRDPA